MSFDLESFSRFKATEAVVVDGVETFGVWKQPSWLSALKEDDLNQFVVPGNMERRPDLISADIYGSSFFFWVLIAVNKPLDPFSWPKTGTVILYPDESIVIANVP